MKKSLLLFCLTFTATLLHAGPPWGTLSLDNLSPTKAVFTNSSISHFSGGNEMGGSSGITASTANGFHYALLVSTSPVSLTDTNPIDSAWASAFVGTYATNAGAPGVLLAAGSSQGTQIPGWDAPTGPLYASSAENYYLLVGWSTTLGNTWSDVSSQLASDNWIAPGFFGVSDVGFGYAGGGPDDLLPQNIFVPNISEPGGFTSGFTMFEVVPEPQITTLAGLGTMLLFLVRRHR